MPLSKSNYTLDGEILAEGGASGRTNYGVDALGSVTSTLVGDALVNRYAYKPYGSLLSKSGAGADPAFQWVGTLGYRQTGRAYSESYVRARHYEQTSGRWTSVDPLWPRERPYDYKAPTTLVDPSGSWSISVFSPKRSITNCGSAEFMVKWTGFRKSDNGWLIQKIAVSGHKYDCGPPYSQVKMNNPVGLVFWEAWQVVAGDVYVGFASGGQVGPYDTFRTVDEGGNAGQVSITGRVGFFRNYTLTVPPWGYDIFGGASIPTIHSKPSLWGTVATKPHRMDVAFQCCCPPDPQTVKTEPAS